MTSPESSPCPPPQPPPLPPPPPPLQLPPTSPLPLRWLASFTSSVENGRYCQGYGEMLRYPNKIPLVENSRYVLISRFCDPREELISGSILRTFGFKIQIGSIHMSLDQVRRRAVTPHHVPPFVRVCDVLRLDRCRVSVKPSMAETEVWRPHSVRSLRDPGVEGVISTRLEQFPIPPPPPRALEPYIGGFLSHHVRPPFLL
jgi:hypothetical protein